jgi:hypothetical protein
VLIPTKGKRTECLGGCVVAIYAVTKEFGVEVVLRMEQTSHVVVSLSRSRPTGLTALVKNLEIGLQLKELEQLRINIVNQFGNLNVFVEKEGKWI